MAGADRRAGPCRAALPALGSWSYEPYETKLARETKAGTVLQLCLYGDLLASRQGRFPRPHGLYHAGGFVAEPYRIDEYIAYYRQVRCELELHLAQRLASLPGRVRGPIRCRVHTVTSAPGTPPVTRRWRSDDHLCLVADMRRSAERELATVPITTTTAFANGRFPRLGGRTGALVKATSPFSPRRAFRSFPGDAPCRVYESLPPRPGEGLARLPEPSVGDLFLDLEGDPFFGEGGLEYLVGLAGIGIGADGYRCWWASDLPTERQRSNNSSMRPWPDGSRSPELHVYHFGHYEPAALKRLASRHATREDELDRLLRGGPLRRPPQGGATRRACRRGELLDQAAGAAIRLHALGELEEAGRARASVEVLLELGRGAEIALGERLLVEAYNRDDCLSNQALRDWLEERRSELQAQRGGLPAPERAARMGHPRRS